MDIIHIGMRLSTFDTLGKQNDISEQFLFKDSCQRNISPENYKNCDS